MHMPGTKVRRLTSCLRAPFPPPPIMRLLLARELSRIRGRGDRASLGKSAFSHTLTNPECSTFAVSRLDSLTPLSRPRAVSEDLPGVSKASIPTLRRNAPRRWRVIEEHSWVLRRRPRRVCLRLHSRKGQWIVPELTPVKGGST